MRHPKHYIKIELQLLEGYTIAANGRYGARLRDLTYSPVLVIRGKDFDNLKGEILCRYENGLFVIDLAKVKKMHGNKKVKRTYQARLKSVPE